MRSKHSTAEAAEQPGSTPVSSPVLPCPTSALSARPVLSSLLCPLLPPPISAADRSPIGSPMAAPLSDSLALLAESNPDIKAAMHTDDAGSAAAAPSVAPAAPVSGAAVERSGFLLKNSYTAPDQFKRYFFRLEVGASVLTYAESPSAPIRGKIELEGCSCEIAPESKYNLAACFELNSPLQSRIYALACDNLEELQGWINVIRKAMLKIRRQKAKDASKKKREVIEGAHQESQQQAAAQAAQANAAAAQPSVTAVPSASSSAENSVNAPSYSSAPSVSSNAPSYAAPNPYNSDRAPPNSAANPSAASASGSAVPVAAAAAGVGVVAAVGAAAMLSAHHSQQQHQPPHNGGFNSASAGAGGVANMSAEDKYTGQKTRLSCFCFPPRAPCLLTHSPLSLRCLPRRLCLFSSVYRQWLDETKQQKDPGSGRGGKGGGRSHSTSQGGGGELHHTLLEEENKRQSVFEQWCGCCPAWCFQ